MRPYVRRPSCGLGMRKGPQLRGKDDPRLFPFPLGRGCQKEGRVSFLFLTFLRPRIFSWRRGAAPTDRVPPLPARPPTVAVTQASLPAQRAKGALQSITAGQKVISKHKNGRFYQCEVVRLTTETFYEVNFDDGSFSDNLYPEDIVVCLQGLRRHLGTGVCLGLAGRLTFSSQARGPSVGP